MGDSRDLNDREVDQVERNVGNSRPSIQTPKFLLYDTQARWLGP